MLYYVISYLAYFQAKTNPWNTLAWVTLQASILKFKVLGLGQGLGD